MWTRKNTLSFAAQPISEKPSSAVAARHFLVVGEDSRILKRRAKGRLRIRRSQKKWSFKPRDDTLMVTTSPSCQIFIPRVDCRGTIVSISAAISGKVRRERDQHYLFGLYHECETWTSDFNQSISQLKACCRRATRFLGLQGY